MEKDFDDCEFWLPPQFLTDDDLLMDFKTHSCVGEGGKDGINPFSYGFNPFGSHSDLSSPVESVVGSTETESDEDDYITGLTRKMAHSTLEENTKGWGLSRSPQSTLCGCKQGSSRGSPNGPSQASSPPRMARPEVSMDLLYAAAGEVARIRMMEESTGLYNHIKAGGGIWAAPPRKTSPVPVGPKNTKPNPGSFNSNQPPLSYQQLQVAQFQRLKQQQMMKQGGYRQFPVNQNQQQVAENRAGNGVKGSLMNLPNSAWPTLQQSQQQQPNTGSGMRAVFLGNPGPKRECAGTGVFLPRRIGTQTETRKKPGCPVILPDRVVQALNLNLEAMEAATRPKSNFTPATYVGLSYRHNMAAAQQRRNQRVQQVAMAQELQLPQEWTY
ncbi:uncharacterized protein LOC107810532 [Nicotiana tabacum]|uniref:Uncharacterized protein LOC107810532 n=1 Tax=Nicotiana tabacum TaxID=4097 RepID=A0A1S4BPJ7_TOBAC|nr:uncharacterized protein LOC104092672 [Nicotiana tomentosiformis]XP_016490812.1 PREDICTED: uncharacterized protein LOC107810532 [Nicotiana tabacum]